MSGSGVPAGRGSRSFDFGADDVLCSYDDFAAPSEPKRPDPADKVLLPPPPALSRRQPTFDPSWIVVRDDRVQSSDRGLLPHDFASAVSYSRESIRSTE